MVKDIGYGLWAIEQAKQIAVFAVHVCMYTAFKHSMRMCSNQECATVCLSVRLCVCVMSVPAQVYGCCARGHWHVPCPKRRREAGEERERVGGLPPHLVFVATADSHGARRQRVVVDFEGAVLCEEANKGAGARATVLWSGLHQEYGSKSGLPQAGSSAGI